jgi:hypothetical protein
MTRVITSDWQTSGGWFQRTEPCCFVTWQGLARRCGCAPGRAVIDCGCWLLLQLFINRQDLGLVSLQALDTLFVKLWSV